MIAYYFLIFRLLMAVDFRLVREQQLQQFNTLGLPSYAPSFTVLKSRADLQSVAGLASQYERIFVLGGGSNVVLAPHLHSLVIKTETRGLRLLQESSSHYVIEAEAGEPWHGFVKACLEQGWHGLENLALIPGTVGAAPVQNIGAYGLELNQRLHSVLAFNLAEQKQYELQAHECGFAYRDSLFKRAGQGQWLIVAVRFLLPKQWQANVAYPDLSTHPLLADQPSSAITAARVFEAVCQVRRYKLPDPAVLANAGSFFKNPVIEAVKLQALRKQYPNMPVYALESGEFKLAAGWLIDQAGWKGRRLGPVGMHDRQALVLVNYGGASATDVDALAGAVKADVQQRFGVVLQQEPVQVG